MNNSTSTPTIEFETPIAFASYYSKEGYLKLVFKRITADIKDVKQHFVDVRHYLGNGLPLPLLSDIRQVRGADKESRAYVSKDAEPLSQISHHALLVGSGMSKIIGNIFIRFSKPASPTRLFTNEAKALEWLLMESNS